MNNRAVAVSSRFFALAMVAIFAVACGDNADGPASSADFDSSGSDSLKFEKRNFGKSEPRAKKWRKSDKGKFTRDDYPETQPAEPVDTTPDAGTEPVDEPDTGSEPGQDAGGDTSPAPTPDAGTSQPNPGSSTDFLNRSDMRALWLWDETPSAQQLLDNTNGARDEFMQFAAAPHGQPARALNRVYFEARSQSTPDMHATLKTVNNDPLLDSTEQPKLRSFIKDAKAQGMAVEYLDGQAIWLATDANAQVPKQICRDVTTFNQSTNDLDERLDGVHFDIEPHTVQSGPWAGEWWANRLPQGYNADWTQRWQNILDDCRATFDAYEAQTGHHLVLASDVGADYAYYNKPILNYLNGSSSPVDYVGLMNYYDNRPNVNGDPSFFYGDDDGSNVTGGVEQNLNLWTNTPVVFGIETGPSIIAPDWASFYQEGYTAMYQTIDTLSSNYGSTNSLGVAIHHYGPNSYKDLQP